MVARLLDEDAYQDSSTVTSSVLAAIALIVVLLRLVTRKFIVKRIGPDDYVIAVALVLLMGNLATIWFLKFHGLGYPHHHWALEKRAPFLKATVALQVTYYLTNGCIKVSILCFYLRFAVDRVFELACKYTIGFLVLWKTATFLVTVFQCVPLSDMWDFDEIVRGNCINTTIFHYFAASVNMITDIWILILPLKTIARIRRPKREICALFFVFGIGIFVCAASILRLHALQRFTLSPDPTYDLVPIITWSSLEANMGIYCSSLPTLRPLFSRAQRERTRNIHYNSYRSPNNTATWNSKREGNGKSSRHSPELGTVDMHIADGHPIAGLPPALTRHPSYEICDLESDDCPTPNLTPEQQV